MGLKRSLYEKTIYVFAVVLVAAVFIVILAACGNNLNRGTATVLLYTGGVADSRGGAPRAVPESVVSFTVEVTADDMDTISESFTGPEIEFQVPAGLDRTFTLTAFDEDGLTPYSGTATVDLAGGQSNVVQVLMNLLSEDNFITSLQFTIDGEVSDETYGIIQDDLGVVLGVVPLDTSLSNLTPTIEVSEGAAISPVSGEPQDFSSGPVTYTVTSAKGTTKEYEIRATGNTLTVLDAAYYGNGVGGRIVSINNLQAEGWKELDYSDFGMASTGDFCPADVDFDIYGRIYIANNVTNGGILRLDNFNDTSPEWLFPSDVVPAIAIDRANGWIYFLDWIIGFDYQLKRCDYNEENIKTYSVSVYNESPQTSSSEPRMELTVDDEGFVYFTVWDTTGSIENIVKFDPEGDGTKVTQEPVGADKILDVLYKDGLIYVSDATNDKIIALDKSLKSAGSSLSIVPDTAGNPSDAGTRPTRLLAVLNKKLYLIDDDESGFDTEDRIIAFDDLTGVDETMWADAGSTTFSFFYTC